MLKLFLNAEMSSLFLFMDAVPKTDIKRFLYIIFTLQSPYNIINFVLLRPNRDMWVEGVTFCADCKAVCYCDLGLYK